MNARRRAFPAVWLLLALAGIVARVRAQDSATAPTQPARSTADLITRDQFDASALRTAWDIVESRRPNWLRQRSGSRPIGPLTAGSSSDTAGAGRSGGIMTSSSRRDNATTVDAPTGVQVYLDGMRMGDLQQLRNIPAAQVYSIRRYNGSEAQFHFGNGHADGALMVSTRPE